MRKILISFLVIVGIAILMSTPGCRKPPVEDPLRVSTGVAALVTSPGSFFDFNLLVESVMPKGGVRIAYTVKGETNNFNYPQGSIITTSDKNSQIRIRNLPAQLICICEITVTSLSKNTNIAKTSFRVVYK